MSSSSEREARGDRGARPHRLAGGATVGRLRCAGSYNSRSPKPSTPYRFFATGRDLAADSDVLVLSCALTEETRRMVNREVLGSGGVLVNVGLVDKPELGVIAGAGLDVYESEPHVPPELTAMDNVVLSDHRAVLTPESIRGALDVVAGNLDAFFAGRPLLSPVTLDLNPINITSCHKQVVLVNEN
ncbi:hypothetical protein EJB05_04970, partial [Eragrostis curvula]